MPTLQDGHHLKGTDMNSRLNHVQNWPELARQTNWSAATMAKKCGISIRTLERYFLKTMSKKPKAWLVGERLKDAVDLLCDGKSIKETALHLGYQHPHHFSREFKAYLGYSPSAHCNKLK
jgi:AraC-like DNA-binding protein